MRAIATGIIALALISGSSAAWARGKGVHLPTKTHHHHHHHAKQDCYFDHYNQICVPHGTISKP